MQIRFGNIRYWSYFLCFHSDFLQNITFLRREIWTYHSCIQNGEICCLFYWRNSADINLVSVTFFIHAILLFAGIHITVSFIRCLLLASRLIQHYKWLYIYLYTFTATCFGCNCGHRRVVLQYKWEELR